MTSQAQKDANRRYDKTNTRQVLIKLNINTDIDILDWLDAQENRQGAIKEAIRSYMRANPADVGGWYGWCRVLYDGASRDYGRKGPFATEAAAIRHAREVTNQCRTKGAADTATMMWERCDADGIPYTLR